MKSHEYAEKLEEMARLLKARPEFDVEWNSCCEYFYFHERHNFVAAVKALGGGKKQYTDDTVYFRPSGLSEDAEIKLAIDKDKLCKLIRPAEYECEPFFTPDEEREAERKSA